MKAPINIEPIYLAVGARIKARRIALGLSQADVGNGMDPPMQKSSITNIERGNQRIQLHTLVQIAAELETTPHELIGWEE